MRSRIFIFFIAFLITAGCAQAAFFSFLPIEIRQADGTLIPCFATGDEYYNWIHDAEGYTIVQAEDGYCYYAILHEGLIVAGDCRVNQCDPSGLGISKWLKISPKEYKLRKAAFHTHAMKQSYMPSTGNVNNLSVFIRFADDSEFPVARSQYDQRFNLANEVSLKSYYQEVSYSQLVIYTTFYPACSANTNYSYQDAHTRNYYQPYNATTNPAGYIDFYDRTNREHTLLKNALDWINQTSPVPPSLDIDSDNNGFVDNISFVVRGGNGGWSSLLWAHSWQLFTYDVFINGKQVAYYTFTPEVQTVPGTLCHETFHSMGAPDLYHYENTSLQPVQSWDLMELGFGHMGAFMKWQYSGNAWINTIPEITSSGTYVLKSLATPYDNCFKIRSPYSNSEYFVLEYRQKTGMYENYLPGSGLLVYRIAPLYYGNSDGPPDEVYIFRPGGTTGENGDPSLANYCLEEGRTIINDTTSPSPFLQDGLPSGIMVHDISISGPTITFQVDISNTEPPSDLLATTAGPNAIGLHWLPNVSGNQVLIASNPGLIWGNPMMNIAYQVGDSIPGGGAVIYVGNADSMQHTGLIPNTLYHYKAWSFDYALHYSPGITAQAYTDCMPALVPYNESFNNDELPNCWLVQQTDPAVELWRINHSSFAGGEENELIAIPGFGNTEYSRIILPPMNTMGITRLGMSFRMKLIDMFQGATVRVQTSNDKVNWTNSSWFVNSTLSGNHDPMVIQVDLIENLYSPATYLAILLEGQINAISSIIFDDFEITIIECDFFQVHLTTDPPGAGNVSGAGNYAPGQWVTVTATTFPGWNFMGWKWNGQLVSEVPVYSFPAEQDVSLVATYSNSKANIVTTIEPASAGYIMGGGAYSVGDLVELEALPSNDYIFDRWVENGQTISSTPGYAFLAGTSRYLTAVFSARTCSVHISSIPDAGGTATGSGGFEIHSMVTLHAVANEGYQFLGWFEEGIMKSAFSEYAFEITGDHYLEARFHCPACVVELLASPVDGGSVEGGGAYASGSTITISATPNTDYVFADWSENGNKISNSPSYHFLVDQYHYFVARFLQLLDVSILVSPPGAGFVVGEGQYIEGQSVTLGAFPNQGYEFLGWTEGTDTLSQEPMLFFDISDDRQLQANFRKVIGTVEAEKEDFLVYPNPSGGFFWVLNLSISPVSISSLELISSLGQAWFPEIDHVSEGILLLDARVLPPGPYQLVIKFTNQTTTRHAVVLRPY